MMSPVYVEILARLDAHETYGQISKALGVTRNTVAGAAYRARKGTLGKPKNVAGRPNPKVRGALNSRAILSDEKVRAIRASSEKGASLAAQYGVHPSTICLIKSGRRWAHLLP